MATEEIILQTIVNGGGIILSLYFIMKKLDELKQEISQYHHTLRLVIEKVLER